MFGVPLGPFHLTGRIDQGGMGQVWHAIHGRSGVPVAVKLLRDDRVHLAGAFLDEVRAVAQLDNPHVIAVLDYGQVSDDAARRSDGRLQAGAPWMAIEFCSGGSLGAAPPTTWAGLRDALLGLLDALSCAHARGLLHRDVTPENVLVATAHDVRPGIKLTDFGLAPLLSRDAPGGSVIGTPAYMAPEQLGERPAPQGPATDLYQLGCVAWALATGQPPFGSQRPAEVLALAHRELDPPPFWPQLPQPPGFEAWVRRLLAKAPRERFRHAAEAAHVLASLDGTTSPTRGFPSGWRTRSPVGLPEGLVDAGLGLWAIRPVPFVGREPARDRLWSALAECASAWQPRVVVVDGPSGTGRTRLLGWLVERARELGAADAFLVGAPSALSGVARCLLHAAVSEGAVAELPQGADTTDGELSAPTIEAAARELGANDADAAALAGLLRPMDSGSGVAPALRVPLLARLVGFAAVRPMVLALDDAHLDTDAIALARAIATLRAPVLVVVAVQSEGIPTHASRGLDELASSTTSSRVRVDPLGGPEEDDLLRRALALAPPLAAEVRLRAAGNPAYAIALVGDLAARGQLLPSDNGFTLVAGGEIGSGLAGSTWADRLDRALGARPEKATAARVGIEVAATLGNRVDEREWAAACALLKIPVPSVALERLARERLVVDDDRPGGLGWRFAHAAIREALIAAALGQGRTRMLNRACARALAAGGKGQRGLNERIGRHLHAAGDHAQALTWLLVAARRRLLRDEVREAAAVIDVAREARRAGSLDADPRGSTVDVLGAIVQLRGGGHGGLRALDQAVASARAAGHDAAVTEGLVARADAWRRVGNVDAAMAALAEARTLAGATGDRGMEARALAGLAQVAAALGDSREAITLVDRAREAAELSGEKLVVSEVASLAIRLATPPTGPLATPPDEV